MGYLAVDKINDLILIQIDYKNKSFIKMADKMPQPGVKIYAIGSPVGLSKTISDGLISGIRVFDNKKLYNSHPPVGCNNFQGSMYAAKLAAGLNSSVNNVCISGRDRKTDAAKIARRQTAA